MIQKLALFLLSVVLFIAFLMILATSKITVPAVPVNANSAAAPAQAPQQPAAAGGQTLSVQPVQQSQPQAAVAGAPQPAAAVAPAPAPAQAPESIAAAPAPKPAPKSTGKSYSYVYYTVKPGDTLYSIAARYNTTVSAIQWANGLTGTLIYPGQVLCIPVSGGGGGSSGGGGGQPPTYGPWYAEFWNNESLQGTPNWVRYDQAINFDWGFDSPQANAIQADRFSARWTTARNIQAGIYTFTMRYDDGMRILVNETIVFDDYNHVGERSIGFAIPITGGNTTIRVEYVERADKARAQVSIMKIPGATKPPESPWTAAFYNNMELTDPVAFTAQYAVIDCDWGTGSPSPLVSIDFFTGRFTKSQYFPGGRYRFVARVNDGVRIFVNGAVVLDEWRQQFATFVSNDIDLTAGYHDIRVDYAEWTGPASLVVYWERR